MSFRGYLPFSEYEEALEGEPMTVCLAAIAENTTIVGASDRMVGLGSTQYQPDQTKIWHLTSSIVAMVASNNVYLQTEIHEKVFNKVRERLNVDIDNWWQVKDVASLYRQAHQEIRITKIEDQILHPKGMDFPDFLQRQKDLAGSVLDDIREELEQFQLPRMSFLLVGNDLQFNVVTPHIYVLEDGTISCRDAVGFAAIGSGASHATSHFTVEAYSRHSLGGAALYNVLWAKKRAERAQGVGQHTDMFIIGNELGSFRTVSDAHIRQLEAIYNRKIGRAHV